MPSELPDLPGEDVKAYRVINSKYPPIQLFDDVASADEFDALFQIQALTNPRLLNEIGAIELIPRDQIPFGIAGCNYATAPFTHVNPAGSRFSDGSYGLLYVANTMETALAEVRYHQNRYWSSVENLNYDRFVFRGLSCRFNDRGMKDALSLPITDAIYHPDDYSQARHLGSALKAAGHPGLKYRSVRAHGNHCWALTTPRSVVSIHQTAHYEMIWNGQILSVNMISGA